MTGLGKNETNTDACSFTIEVVGEGTANANPEIAVIQLGVVSEGESLETIQRENAAAINGITAALKSLGTQISDISTAAFGIEPRYTYEDGTQQFQGYQVTHMLSVTLNDIAMTGTVIDTAVANGANRVSEVTFQAANTEAAYHQALANAIKQAQEKAAVIANTLGVSLSAIPCKVEESGFTPPGQPLFKAAAAMDSFGTSIIPGQLTYRATVRVWYMFA
ncbi:SIMPL domain-containing protein [Paenibacillus sp. CAU 1782]